MKGEVIGINSNILTREPAATSASASPSPRTWPRKSSPSSRRKARSSAAGWASTVLNQPIDEDTRKLLNLSSRKGALINSVDPGSPADKGRAETVRRHRRDQRPAIENNNDLRMKIADIQPGAKVDLKIIRDGKEKIITATIAELEDRYGKPVARRSSGKDVGLTGHGADAQPRPALRIRTTTGPPRHRRRQRERRRPEGPAAGRHHPRSQPGKGRHGGRMGRHHRQEEIGRRPPSPGPPRRRDGQAQDFIVTIRIP